MRVVIIGAGAAGLTLASNIRKNDDEYLPFGPFLVASLLIVFLNMEFLGKALNILFKY